MKTLKEVQVLREKRLAGRPKKILDHRKLDKIRVAVPRSADEAVATLLVFDARCMDVETRQELLRICPQLVHIRRAWRAEYMECGCLSCHRKKEWYGAGGLCMRCYGRISARMLKRYRSSMTGRDLPAELAAFQNALSLRYNTAQRLLNGNLEG